MTFAVDRWYRLAPRGGPGLACDGDGLALGAIALTRAHLDARGVRRLEVRPPGEIGRVLQAAYGPQRDEVLQHLHRGLGRAAARLDVGELGHAGIEAVMLGVPDLTPDAVAKLAQLADIEKGGHAWWEEAWRDEPRVPKRHTGGGQWTTEGARAPTPQGEPAGPDGPRGRGNPMFDDGVYRPGADNPRFIPIGGPPEMEDEEPVRGSNGPPDEFTYLQEIFPGLKDNPGLSVPLAFLDRFTTGINAYGNQISIDQTEAQYEAITSEIKSLDPNYVHYDLWPSGGIAGMSRAGRENLIDDLRMERAATFYRVRKDPGWLQVETVRFLSKTVDDGYAHAMQKFRTGELEPIPSARVAIGNEMDDYVRTKLKILFNIYNISYGKGKDIIINNRDYDTSKPKATYRRPDARIGNISFDWTLEQKTSYHEQIRGFFGADSRPIGVIIIRPTELGHDTSYIILRPRELIPKR